MERTKKIQDFIDSFVKEKTGRTLSESQEKKSCAWCREKIKGFKDELSKKEYSISGLCQKCQDKTFG